MQAWQNKIAVVTGASRGIGRAVAVGLAQQGVRVVLVARGHAQLQETKHLIDEAGGIAWVLPADIGQPAAA